MLRPVADLLNIGVQWGGESKTIELFQFQSSLFDCAS